MPGTFFGYREMPVTGGLITLWKYPSILPELRLEYWDWANLGPIPFWYENFRGNAEDDYPADFVIFPFVSRLLMVTVRDGPAEIIFTFDGVTEQPERRFETGFAAVEAARGFKIRNAELGRTCRYQVIPSI